LAGTGGLGNGNRVRCSSCWPIQVNRSSSRSTSVRFAAAVAVAVLAIGFSADGVRDSVVGGACDGVESTAARFTPLLRVARATAVLAADKVSSNGSTRSE
jgi:hypothetical protein